MGTSSSIEDLVDRFVNDLLGIVHQVRSERRAAMLEIVMSMLADQRPRPKASPSWSHKPTKATRARPAKAAPKKGNNSGAAVQAPSAPSMARPARHPRVIAVPVDRKAMARGPLNGRSSTVSTMNGMSEDAHDGSNSETKTGLTVAERDALVLGAVRSLVRPTASEIARHCGLASASTYVTLRGLLTSGLVAKTETARGQEYSLVSSGGIRPFKRTKDSAAEPSPSDALTNGSANGHSSSAA